MLLKALATIPGGCVMSWHRRPPSRPQSGWRPFLRQILDSPLTCILGPPSERGGVSNSQTGRFSDNLHVKMRIPGLARNSRRS